MGKYHPNLTDQAVLERVVIAKKEQSKSLVFEVPKANLKFRIEIKEKCTDKELVYDSPEGCFTIIEITKPTKESQ